MELKSCPLFNGIEQDGLDVLLSCLAASRRTFAKDEFIFTAGARPSSVGIVMTGGVRVVKEDYEGNRLILTHIKPGGLFGEAFSCAEVESLPVSVIAAEKSDIMTVDYRKTISVCSSSCAFHTRLIMNMLQILANKNIMLTQRMEHLSKRTAREKILSYLAAQADGNGKAEIPFNRQELADYLCADRSALSRELSLMRDDGLIKYEKNRFELIKHI